MKCRNSARRALLWQLIAKIRIEGGEDSHYIQLLEQCIREDSYCSKWQLDRALVSEQQWSSVLDVSNDFR